MRTNIPSLFYLFPLKHVLHETPLASQKTLLGNLDLNEIKKTVTSPTETYERSYPKYLSNNLFDEFNIDAAAKNIKINTAFRGPPPPQTYQNIFDDSIAKLTQKIIKKYTTYVGRKHTSKAKKIYEETLLGCTDSIYMQYG